MTLFCRITHLYFIQNEKSSIFDKNLSFFQKIGRLKFIHIKPMLPLPILHQNALAAFFDNYLLIVAPSQLHHQFAGNGKRQRHFARPRQFADIFFGNFSVHKFGWKIIFKYDSNITFCFGLLNTKTPFTGAFCLEI